MGVRMKTGFMPVSNVLSEGNVETTELRDKILSLTLECSGECGNTHCPLGYFRGLSYDSRKNILEQMEHEKLLSLLELGECETAKDLQK